VNSHIINHTPKPHDNLRQIKKSLQSRPSWLDNDGYIKVWNRKSFLTALVLHFVLKRASGRQSNGRKDGGGCG
jgi:hypothetical protein